MFKCFCRAALHAHSESYVERCCRSDSKVPQIFSLSSRDQLKHRKCLSSEVGANVFVTQRKIQKWTQWKLLMNCFTVHLTEIPWLSFTNYPTSLHLVVHSISGGPSHLWWSIPYQSIHPIHFIAPRCYNHLLAVMSVGYGFMPRMDCFEIEHQLQIHCRFHSFIVKTSLSFSLRFISFSHYWLYVEVCFVNHFDKAGLSAIRRVSHRTGLSNQLMIRNSVILKSLLWANSSVKVL